MSIQIRQGRKFDCGIGRLIVHQGTGAHATEAKTCPIAEDLPKPVKFSHFNSKQGTGAWALPPALDQYRVRKTLAQRSDHV